MKQPSDVKISAEQKTVIVEFMEKNSELANLTYLNVKNRALHNDLWNHLTILLNSTPGPKKDKIKWQKAWSGLKKAIRMKLKKIQVYNDKKTGQYIFYPKLNYMDERIIALMKNKNNNRELDLNSSDKLNSSTDESSDNVLNIKMKEEKSLKTCGENINLSPVPSIIKKQLFGIDDQSDNTFEEISNCSWNSHDIRNSNHEKSLGNNHIAMFTEKLSSISMQLEQLIEQNSVSNILLERIATSLEHRNIK